MGRGALKGQRKLGILGPPLEQKGPLAVILRSPFYKILAVVLALKSGLSVFRAFVRGLLVQTTVL